MKKEEKIPEQAIFYQNYKGAIYAGTPKQVKDLMVAFCKYAFDHEEPKVPASLNMIWETMKNSIDADRKHYTSVCERNKENALKRWNKAKEQAPIQPEEDTYISKESREEYRQDNSDFDIPDFFKPNQNTIEENNNDLPF